MQKKVVPFLVLLMSFSLLGIIVTQYRWIKNTLNEKQSLINNQVGVILSNVEEQLSDLKGAELIQKRVFIESTDSLKCNDSSQFRTSVYGVMEDSLSAVNLEVFTYANHESELNLFHELITVNDSTATSLDHEINQIIKLIRKVDIEKSNYRNDIRFDSLSVSKILKKELLTLDDFDGLNWGLFDNSNQVYKINPTDINNIDYQKNLFSTDLLEPNRYQLQIGINSSELVWKEIKLMILLSVLFLIIIVFVFAFSIRLLLKHKKISEIKSDFINNMTHEFKTPLSSISLAADTIIHPGTIKNELNLNHYVNIIQTERKKLNHHVERILEVGALKKDALEIEIESVDLNEIMRSAIEDLELISSKSNANITMLSDQKVTVQANSMHLKNAIVNIIENAIKYSDDTPKINIHISALLDTASIKIEDKGVGMTTKALKHVFKDFYRVQSGNIHKTKGFGLGLSYCRLVIEKMGGSIGVKSQLEIGTEVNIKLRIG